MTVKELRSLVGVYSANDVKVLDIIGQAEDCNVSGLKWSLGYHSRKYYEVCPYSGRYGEGVKVHLGTKDSTRFHLCFYVTVKNKNIFQKGGNNGN